MEAAQDVGEIYGWRDPVGLHRVLSTDKQQFVFHWKFLSRFLDHTVAYSAWDNTEYDLTGTRNQFDMSVNVQGGGIMSQAEAIRHGTSKALLHVNAEFKDTLKKAGLLTRDSRVKERKKYGRRGARRRPQFSKR